MELVKKIHDHSIKYSSPMAVLPLSELIKNNYTGDVE